MTWKHGYYAASGYTHGFYPETMPARLRWASLLQDHQVPAEGFRYLDAGCGQGFNLVMAAACHPDSEFVGVDFLPEHIAHARALAEQCGLDNVRFIEADFIALAQQPETLGAFDFAVCHGISTWVAPDVRAALFRLLGQVLKPGGLLYNSYNTLPGWLTAVPLQHLVSLEQQRLEGRAALAAARGSFARLREAAPALFGSLAGLESQLQALAQQDPAYLVQEYNNQHWQPMFVSQMIESLAAVKLDYLGTATLLEAYDGLLPAAAQQLLTEQTQPVLREQLRDYVLNQAFRRDLYVKGQRRPWRGEHQRLLRSLRVAVNPNTALPVPGAPFLARSGTIEARGQPAFHAEVLRLLGECPAGLEVGALLDALRGSGQQGDLLQALSLLMHGGWVTPALPPRQDTRRALNLALAAAVLDGAPYAGALLPGTGGLLPLSETDWCFLDAALRQLDEAQWIEHALTALRCWGKTLVREGRTLSDPAEQRAWLVELIVPFRARLLPYLRAMQAL